MPQTTQPPGWVFCVRETK